MKLKYTYKDNSAAVCVKPNPIKIYHTVLLILAKPSLHGQNVAPVIFECIADNILEADKLFDHALNNGTLPIKIEKGKKGKKLSVVGLAHVGCSISKLTKFEKVVDWFHGICHSIKNKEKA